MNIRLLYFDGCPHWETAAERLDTVLGDRGLAAQRVRIDDAAHAEESGLRGSPTILIDGRDPFALGDEPYGFACRLYSTPDGLAGSPTVEQLRAVLDQHPEATS